MVRRRLFLAAILGLLLLPMRAGALPIKAEARMGFLPSLVQQFLAPVFEALGLVADRYDTGEGTHSDLGLGMDPDGKPAAAPSPGVAPNG